MFFNKSNGLSIIVAALFSVALFVCASLANALDPVSQKADYFWPNKLETTEIKKVFDLNYIPIRFKYFEENDTRIWLLKEYGKEQLIDFRVVVNNKKIVSLNVLEYREAYGGEIKRSNFRRQFIDATLDKIKNAYELSKQIDGISGATISVDASKNVAKLALFLDSSLSNKLDKKLEKKLDSKLSEKSDEKP